MMKELAISMVIEALPEDIHEIKGRIIAAAAEAMVGCHTEIIETKPDAFNPLEALKEILQ